MSLGRLSPAPWVIQTRHSSAMARYLDSHFNIHSDYCGPPPGFEVRFYRDFDSGSCFVF